LYEPTDIRNFVNEHVETHNLQHSRKTEAINLDQWMKRLLDIRDEEDIRWMRRDEVFKRLEGTMEPWHKLSVGALESFIGYDNDFCNPNEI